jgi:hypothetical protein
MPFLNLFQKSHALLNVAGRLPKNISARIFLAEQHPVDYLGVGASHYEGGPSTARGLLSGVASAAATVRGPE